ncbi:MAG: hypothetical protein IJS51_01015 [Treponema sp.]|nr:hypothetical protein [Treponema sp.]
MNDTRYAKFFIGFFLTVATIAVFRWGVLKNTQFEYMDGEFPYWIQQKDYVQAKDDENEVLFLGDSRMKAALIPNELCENAYNLALGGATSVEMYYTLKRYLKNHLKPKEVIAAFGGFHYQLEDCFKPRTLYFHFLSLWEEFEAISTDGKLNAWKFQQIKTEIINALKYDLLFPQKYTAACINSKFQRGDFNHGQCQALVNNKGHMFFGLEESAPLNTEAEAPHFTVAPRIDFYLRKIISLCKENDISLFIEQLPMNYSWDKTKAGEWYKDFFKYFSDLETQTGITIEKEIPCYEPDFFGDPSHVNPHGAKRFTAYIKEKYGL